MIASALGLKMICDVLDTNNTHMHSICSLHRHHTPVTTWVCMSCKACCEKQQKLQRLLGLKHAKFSLNEKWNNCFNPYLTVSAVQTTGEQPPENTPLGLIFVLYGWLINSIIPLYIHSFISFLVAIDALVFLLGGCLWSLIFRHLAVNVVNKRLKLLNKLFFFHYQEEKPTVNLASTRSDADVMVTVDLADEMLTAAMPSNQDSLQQPTVIVHSSVDAGAAASASVGGATASERSSATTAVEHENNASNIAAGGPSLRSAVCGLVGTSTREQGAVGMTHPSVSGVLSAAVAGATASNMRLNNELTHHSVGAMFRRHVKSEARKQLPPEVQRVVSAGATAGGSTGANSSSMSVSVPNLTTTMEQTVSLLESFAAVARRNLGNNTNNMVSGSNNPCSSLVRLALSSNSPGRFSRTQYLLQTFASIDIIKI